MLEAFPGKPAEEAKLASLKVPKARQLGQLLAKGRPFAKLLTVFRQPDTGQEAVVFEVEVELGQKQLVPINRFEPIAAVFAPEDRAFPEVLALREDFPITSHQNLRPYLRPRSLCLYEAHYEEVKATWTASAFVERIREWLRKAAVNQLHDPDQPLEPLFFSSEGIALISREMLTDLGANETIPISAGVFGTERNPIFSIRKNTQPEPPAKGPRPIVTLVTTPPSCMGSFARNLPTFSRSPMPARRQGSTCSRSWGRGSRGGASTKRPASRLNPSSFWR